MLIGIIGKIEEPLGIRKYFANEYYIYDDGFIKIYSSYQIIDSGELIIVKLY